LSISSPLFSVHLDTVTEPWCSVQSPQAVPCVSSSLQGFLLSSPLASVTMTSSQSHCNAFLAPEAAPTLLKGVLGPGFLSASSYVRTRRIADCAAFQNKDQDCSSGRVMSTNYLIRGPSLPLWCAACYRNICLLPTFRRVRPSQGPGTVGIAIGVMSHLIG